MALFQRFRTRYVESAPEGEEWPPPGPRSVGDMLRQRREALGLDLADVAAALRIKPAYLLALEDGDPDRLPGPAYAIGFLRAYGDHLGLDSEEILRQFKAVSSGLDTRPDLSFPMPLGESSIPGGAMLLVAVILALCGYGTWYYLSTAERSRPERVTAVPAALLPPPGTASPAIGDGAAASRPPASTASAAPPGEEKNPAPDSETTTKLVPGLASPALSTPAAVTLATPAAAPSPPGATVPSAALSPGEAGASGPSVQPPVPAASVASAAPPAAAVASATPPAVSPQREPPQAYGAAAKTSHIVIIATADSWVQVHDPDGSTLFSRVLKPGESYRVPDRPGLTLRTGNAGGLDITVDGKAVPAIGHNGEIRHNVNLDPQALTAGTAAQQ